MAKPMWYTRSQLKRRQSIRGTASEKVTEIKREDFMKHSLRFLFLLLSLALLGGSALGQTVPPELINYPDTILHNGKIATMEDKTTSSNPGTIVQALAIREGKVLSAGTNQRMLALKGPQTKIVDLKGRTVVPGIIDTHSHLFDYALDSLGDASPRTRLKAEQNDTWESIKQRTLETVRREAAKRKAAEWIALDLPRQAIGKDGKPMDAVQAAM